MEIKAYIIEFNCDDEGGRTFYPEALPAHTAFAAAKEMAKDGLRPTVVALRINSTELPSLIQGKTVRALFAGRKSLAG